MHKGRKKLDGSPRVLTMVAPTRSRNEPRDTPSCDRVHHLTTTRAFKIIPNKQSCNVYGKTLLQQRSTPTARFRTIPEQKAKHASSGDVVTEYGKYAMIQQASGRTVFRCSKPDCKLILGTRKEMQSHANQHRPKRFICHYEGCTKRFRENAKLKRHFLVHTKEKPHKCAICGKLFTHKFNMKAHMRTHTDAKPFASTSPGINRTFAKRLKFDPHSPSQPRAFLKKKPSEIEFVQADSERVTLAAAHFKPSLQVSILSSSSSLDQSLSNPEALSQVPRFLPFSPMTYGTLQQQEAKSPTSRVLDAISSTWDDHELRQPWSSPIWSPCGGDLVSTFDITPL